MLKRPLHAQFGPKVLAGIKRTTIRDTAWPLHKPIMLYHWTGKPYRSPQQDVAAVEVSASTSIKIVRLKKPHARHETEMQYMADLAWWVKNIGSNPLMPPDSPERQPLLWQLEGFDSRDAMDAWFLPLIKPGQTLQKHLMLFRLLNPEPSNLKPVSP